MSDAQPVFVAAYPDKEETHGVFSRFEPGTRTLPAGFTVAPGFQALPVDIVMEKDVAVTLRDGVTIYVDTIPVHSFDRVEKLAPGEIACVDIDLFPIGLVLYPGEQLRLMISGDHILGGVMPGNDNVVGDNHGRHIVHTGGSFASYLQLCVKPLGEA